MLPIFPKLTRRTMIKTPRFARSMASTGPLNFQTFPLSQHLSLSTVPVSFSVPQVMFLYKIVLMSYVEGWIAATKPTMTPGVHGARFLLGSYLRQERKPVVQEPVIRANSCARKSAPTLELL